MKTIKNYFRNNTHLFLVLFLLSISLPIPAVFEMSKYSINNGQSQVAGQRFEIDASISQVDGAGKILSSQYELSPGFWQQNTDLIFINEFE